MKILRTGQRLLVLTGALAAWATLTYACTVEEENPATARSRSADAAAEGAATTPEGTTPTGAPVCGKYGGYDGAKKIAASIIAEVAQDCRINGPIAALDPTQTQHLAECFEILVGGAFQCPGIAYVGGQTKDSKGQRCRSMLDAHKGLNLRKADFDAFAEDIAKALATEGVTPEDIRALAPAFEGYRTGVVQTNNQPDKNTHCACPNGLYEGQACVPEAGVVDAGPDALITDAAADG